MKKLIAITLLSIFSAQAFALPNSEKLDSIIINIGKKKRIVFWGETKADLKSLEKYDLNRIIRQMNQDLEEMPSNVKRSVRQDYEGNSYTNETTRQQELEGLTPWQRLKRNTYLNLAVGFTNAKYLSRNNNLFNPYKTTEELFRQNVGGSPHLSVALIRQESFIRTGNKEILLRYGFDFSWYFIKSVSTQRQAYLLKLNSANSSAFDTLAIYRPAASGNYYTAERYSPTIQQRFGPVSTYNQSLFYSNFKIVPTLNLYGNANQKTFHFGFGAYIGTLLGGSKIYKEIRQINQLASRTPIRSKDNPYRYGLILNIGYKALSFFLESDINNFFQSRSIQNSILPFENSDTKWSQNLTTFGIKIGR